MAEEELKLVEKARGLPLGERAGHTKWRVRNELWQEVASQAGQAEVGHLGESWVGEVAPLVSKGLKDSNAAAQASALEALCALLQKTPSGTSPFIRDFGKDACDAMADKCFSARPNSVRRASEAVSLFAELGVGDMIIESLIYKAFSHKLVKVTISAIDAVRAVLRDYGGAVVDPRPIMKALPPLFEPSKDAKVRNAAKLLAAELCRWVGSDVVHTVLLSKVREATRKDVEALVAKAAAAGSQAPTKQVRNCVANGPPGLSDVGGSSEDKPTPPPATPKVDAYELSDPVDALALVAEGFWKDVKADKWSERKQALVNLKQTLSVPRMEDGDTSGLVRELKKVIALDSNVACVNAAIECVAPLAAGLRGHFAPGARAMLPCLLDKFKEKSTLVTRSIHASLAACTAHCLLLTDVSEDIVSCMKHKHPKLRSETMRVCAHALEGEWQAAAAPRAHATVLAEAAAATSDSSPEVREAAMALVAQFVKVAGSLGAVEKHIGALDAAKRKKLEQPVGDEGGKAREGSKAKNGKKGRGGSDRAVGSSKAKKAAPTKATLEGKKATRATPKRKDTTESPREQDVPLIDAEYSEKVFVELIGDELHAGLKGSTWKQRLEAVQQIKEQVLPSVLASGSAGAACLAAGLCATPGWGESNFQVLKGVFECLDALSCAPGPLVTKATAALVTAGCVEKVADTKLNKTVLRVLDSCSEAVGAHFVMQRVHADAQKHRNPKVLAEAIAWMATAVNTFGAGALQPEVILAGAVADLDHANAGVRAAASTLAATVLLHTDGEGRDMLDGLKPSQKSAIEGMVTKLGAGGVPQPSRKTRGAPKAKKSRDSAPSSPSKPRSASKVAKGPANGKKPAESELEITQGLLERMSSSVWKERQRALEELARVMRTNPEAIGSYGAGEVALALKLRLSDSNKNLVVMALAILAEVSALAPHWERHFKLVVADVLRCMCDNKKTVREGAIHALRSWAAVLQIKVLCPHLLLFMSEGKTNLDGKLSLLTFLGSQLAESAMQFDACLGEVLTIVTEGLQVKAIEVRDVSSAMLKSVIEAFEPEKVGACLGEMNGKQAGVLKACCSKLGFDISASSSDVRPRTAQAGCRPSGSRSERPSTAPSRTPGSQRKVRPGLTREPAVLDIFFLPNEGRSERARQAASRKPSSSKFEEPVKPQDLARIQQALSPHLSPGLDEMLFHKDFKCQGQGAEAVTRLLRDGTKEQKGNTLSNCDLLLQWARYRVHEGNTQILVKTIDLLVALLSLVAAEGTPLSDYEVSLVLPCLVERCGHNQDRLRQGLKDLILRVCGNCSLKVALPMLLHGLGLRKNHRARVVCLEALDALLDTSGPDLAKPRVVKEISVLLSEREASLKTSALALITKIYHIIGEDVWRGLASLPDDVKVHLEHKFKASSNKHKLSKPKAPPAGVQESSPPRADHEEATGKGSSTPLLGTLPQLEMISKTPTELGDSSLSQARPSPLNGEHGSPAVQEAARSWTYWLAQTGSEDHTECVNAMKQLCHHLVQFGNNASALDVTLLIDSADGLVATLSQKITAIFERAIAQLRSSKSKSAPQGSSRGCKYALNTLMHCFQQAPVAASVSESTLRGLMRGLLVLLLHESLPSLEEGGQLLKALNVLMLKVLENGNRTRTLLALLWLLGAGSEDLTPNLQGKFSDLVIKCMIKQTKQLGAVARHMDLGEVLGAIHGFLSSVDGGGVRGRLAGDDKPLRMAKTLLHELCKIEGAAIFDHMSHIPRDGERKQLIYTYLDLYVKTTCATGRHRAGTEGDRGSASQARSKDAIESAMDEVSARPAASPNNTSDLKGVLAAIFRKIGDTSTTQEGLEELFDFSERHSGIDIMTHLSKTSVAFQDYIKDGLVGVSRQRQRQQAARSRALVEINPKADSAGGAPALPSVEQLKQRMERAKIHIAGGEQGSLRMAAPASVAPEAPSCVPVYVPKSAHEMGKVSIEDLQQRISKLTQD